MRFAFTLAAALALAGCGASVTAPDANTSYRVIAHGSGFPTFNGVATINNAAAWTQFIQQFELRAPSNQPEDSIPPINFATETAVALSPGQRPTGGYRLEVERVEQNANGIVVSAREVVPCVGTTVLTHPLTVIAVPKFSGGTIGVNWARVPCQP
jgi:hypothetical protein